MVFSGMVFLFAFLPAVFIAYFLTPNRFKNLILLIASLFFYAWGEPKYILLMLASVTAAYVTGLFADRKKYGKKKAFIAALAAVVWNIGLLLFFKYSDFFVINANSIFGTQLKLPGLALPIGISFYSFQSLSYVIDVYRGEVKPQKNFVTLATYVALFPQLVAGPIVRYIDIERQLENRSFSLQRFAAGIKRFAVGLAKKAVLANGIYVLFTEISSADNSQMSVAAAWMCALAYTFQIYFDFSGYSDMAIGLGKMFGFDFLENFNYPYISKSITEFWRRWHMSLSSWFRDYVYIPLGGNRKGKARQCLNIMIVWFLTGFWHGANWNFALWGVYFGVLLIIEKLFLKKAVEKLPKFFSHLYALVLIVVGWEIFAFEDTSQLILNLKNMFGLGGLPLWNAQAAMWAVQYLPITVILIVGSTPLMKHFGEFLNEKKPYLYGLLIEPLCTAFMLVISAAYLASSSFNPFLYFRF
ncbi:MAG: MBOAT family O-acyltransferase [Oscillospiraceae bacterium]